MTAFVQEFKQHAQKIAGDLRHRELIQTALRKYEATRDKTKAGNRCTGEQK